MTSIFNKLPKKPEKKVMYTFKLSKSVLEAFKKLCEKNDAYFGNALEALIVAELEKQENDKA